MEKEIRTIQTLEAGWQNSVRGKYFAVNGPPMWLSVSYQPNHRGTYRVIEETDHKIKNKSPTTLGKFLLDHKPDKNSSRGQQEGDTE